MNITSPDWEGYHARPGSSGMLKMGCPGSRARAVITEILPAAVWLRDPLYHLCNCSMICRLTIYNLHTPSLPLSLQNAEGEETETPS